MQLPQPGHRSRVDCRSQEYCALHNQHVERSSRQAVPLLEAALGRCRNGGDPKVAALLCRWGESLPKMGGSKTVPTRRFSAGGIERHKTLIDSRLLQPIPQAHDSDRAYYFVVPEGREHDPLLARFGDWLARTAAEQQRC